MSGAGVLVAVGAGVGDGAGVGVDVGAADGEPGGEAVTLGFGVGFGVAVDGGLGDGDGLGVGVAVAAGLDGAGAATVMVARICSGWIWQKYGYDPGALNVKLNDPPGPTTPESNRPSVAPGAPDVTVWGSPAKVQATVSPTSIVSESGAKAKFLACTVNVAA